MKVMRKFLYLFQICCIFYISGCIGIPIFKTPLDKTKIPISFNNIIGEWEREGILISITRNNEYLYLKHMSSKLSNHNNGVFPEHHFSVIDDKLFLSYKMEKSDPLSKKKKNLLNNFVVSKYLIFNLYLEDDVLIMNFFSEEQLYNEIIKKELKEKVFFYDCDPTIIFVKREELSIPKGCMIFDIEQAELKKIILNNSPKLFIKDEKKIVKFRRKKGTF